MKRFKLGTISGGQVPAALIWTKRHLIFATESDYIAVSLSDQCRFQMEVLACA
jgi:hypothetical protein